MRAWLPMYLAGDFWTPLGKETFGRLPHSKPQQPLWDNPSGKEDQTWEGVQDSACTNSFLGLIGPALCPPIKKLFFSRKVQAVPALLIILRQQSNAYLPGSKAHWMQ